MSSIVMDPEVVQRSDSPAAPESAVAASSAPPGASSPSAISCRRIDTFEELERLAPAWQELLEASLRPEPMLAPAWVLEWWRIYGPGRTLAVGAFFDGDRLVGLAPLCRRTHVYRPGIPFRRLEWLASEGDQDGVCSDYLHLIVRRGFETVICERFVRELIAGTFGGWDEWILTAMDGTHPLNPILIEAWERAGFSVERSETSAAPYLTLPPSWHEYLESLSKKRRRTLLQSQRDFDRWAGAEVEYQRAVDADSLARGKKILQDLHRERWEQVGGGGVFQSSRFTTFHDAYFQHLLDEGRLWLHWVTVGGKPIAVTYGFSYGKKIYYYQAGRQTGLPSRVRVGIVLLMHVLQQAMAENMAEFDFLQGASQYKHLFTESTRPILALRVVRAGFRERVRKLCRWGYHHVRNGWSRFRSTPDVPRSDHEGVNESEHSA